MGDVTFHSKDIDCSPCAAFGIAARSAIASPSLTFLPSLSPWELQQFYGVVTRSVGVNSHVQMLHWLQGDMQRYLPHSILIAAWGDFHGCDIQYDILSPLVGVRSQNANPKTLTPLLFELFSRWRQSSRKPLALNADEGGFLLHDSGLTCALGDALQNMRSAMLHDINDERGHQDCLYVIFSEQEGYEDDEREAMAVILPYLDTALRQLEHLPHQLPANAAAKAPTNASPMINVSLAKVHDLSCREAEVLTWVALGKTNIEIGSILSISGFTVKNHMQRIFKKLDVSNRAQAVGKFGALASNA